jgi:hypothetical protein
MSKGADAATMIIPRGTSIEIDAHGQLSIRTPGNLVIQNSGAYGTIESVTGSIRIDHNVEVEAVAVRCAETCYVQGSLTAWKVQARSLHVEETAQAQIVLQETERLEIGRDARVVGNFDSEKELFLLFSRFARQVRTLPFYFDKKDGPAELGDGAREDAVDVEIEDDEPTAAPPSTPAAEAAPTRPAARANGSGERGDLPESLFFARVLLERDAAKGEYGPTSQRVLQEIINLLTERDLETLRHTHRTLFSRILEPRPDVERARELVAQHYDAAPVTAAASERDEEDETVG